jgi:hypothetical protein
MSALPRSSPNDCERSVRYFCQLTPQGLLAMQTIVLSCVFGAVCTMVLWVVSSASVKRDELMRRSGRLFPPEEI